MPIADKYRLHRQVGWSDAAEVHAGPLDPTHKVAVAVKLRHGIGGDPRPEGNRVRFLRAASDQQAAHLAGCKGVAPIFETGREENEAFYVTKLYPRSLDSLIQGRVTLDPDGMHHVADGVLKALEDLRDKHGRSHGNLKPTNIFVDGKTLQSSPVVLSDLAVREEGTSQAADCQALGESLYQLLRARTVRHFDWPMEHGPDWEKLGPLADAWRRFCNVLMSPDLSAQAAPLADVRQAFKKMRSLAKAPPSLGGMAVSAGGRPKAPTGTSGGNKSVLAGAGAAIVAVVGGGVFYFSQAKDKAVERLKTLPGAASAVSTLVPAVGTLAKNLPGVVDGSPTPGEPPSGGGAARGGAGPSAPGEPTAEPTVAEATPLPTPTPMIAREGDKWIGYNALLGRLKETANDPAIAEQPEPLNLALATFKQNIGYQPISSEREVGEFLQRLPSKLEATGDQPDLPANLWTKRGTARQEEIVTATYEWGKTGFQMQFNRVAPPGGNGPAFYLSATTVPVRFGVQLAQASDAGTPLRGGGGPVAWENAGGYRLRRLWLEPNAFNPFYANTGGPTADSPMNGLSGADALRLARAAGCSLPTLAQWNSTLNSPAGQAWASRWREFAKVRSPDWSRFAKEIQAKRATGSVLPNTQCFGDKANLEAVGMVPESNLFFEPVNTRVLKSFAHLIGNVGQYVVDDAKTPTRYYFAGGSAESAPSTVENLSQPPGVPSPFATAADAGFRLAVPAKGSGSEKNPALDKLRRDLDAELARVQKLQQ